MKKMIQRMFAKANTTRLTGLALIVATAVPASAYSIESSLSFTNRYVTEGTDNDPDATTWSLFELSVPVDQWSFELFYGQALRGGSYNEVGLVTAYNWSMGDVDLLTGIHHVRYPSLEDSSSWEWLIGFELEPIPGLEFFGELFYDFDDVKGGFLELGAAAPIEFEAIPNFSLTPVLIFGVDLGYESGVRSPRGSFLQPSVHAEYEINDQLSVFAAAYHQVGLSVLNDLGEPDLSWVSFGLGGRF